MNARTRSAHHGIDATPWSDRRDDDRRSGQDDVQRRAIRQHLWRCGFFPPQQSIDVHVQGPHVIVSGRVAAPEDVRVVAALVAMHDGVVTVENLLTWGAGDRVSSG